MRLSKNVFVVVVACAATMMMMTVTIGCADGGKRPLGATCGSSEECESGLCLEGMCVDPNGDEDGDGLTNGIEAALGTNYRSSDTDGDGIDDLTEVGGNPDAPLDADGDWISGANNLHDALEPANDDSDHDCLFDQFDSDDRDVRAERAAEVCSFLGICGAQASGLGATCTPGEPPTWACDYSGVDGYTADVDARCDGADEDCDGAVDEDFAGVETVCPEGSCSPRGVTRCVDGVESDTCGMAPAADDATCDGFDDDCDGVTDEDFAGSATSCGRGACARTGTRVCRDGAIVDTCTPGAAAEDDATCDGVDEDCDGTADEGYVSVATSCGRGACARTGMRTCRDGAPSDSCAPGTPAAGDATCDAVDDDCDGQTDEQYVSRNTTCGEGACAGSGVTSCVSGDEVDGCEIGSGTPQDANCDGVDDDCDGATDEDFVSVTTSCGVGACASTGTRVCAGGALQDSCTPGAPLAASDVTCDGVDDDCDGDADEDYAASATSCGVGACARGGTRTCQDGAEADSCTPGAPAVSDTTCDGIDEDCNGDSDEDFVPASSSCGVGACQGTGTRTCVDGSVADSCEPGAPLSATDATCDGVDDDCGGGTDEDFLTTTTSCGTGACASTGTLTCVLGEEVDSCVAGAAGGDDATCDGVDDDCSGETDEDFPATTTACGEGACASSGTLGCANGQVVDSCVPGEPQCGDAVCGSDGCGGVCGECGAAPAECVSVACVSGGCETSVERGFCYIDGTCYANGALEPGNACRQCDTARDTGAWSHVAPETRCTDDGLDCTDDVCDGEGTCLHPPLPELTPCDDGDTVTVMDGCWEGTCGGWERRVEPAEATPTAFFRVSRGALAEGLNAATVLFNVEVSTLRLTEYGAANVPSKTTSFNYSGLSAQWGFSNNLLVLNSTLWEWVDGAWTSVSETDSLRAAWNGCQEFCDRFAFVRRQVSSFATLNPSVWGVGRTAGDDLVARRCDPPGLCFPGAPCGWSCTATNTRAVAKDYAAGLAFFGGQPIIGTNVGSSGQPSDIRVLTYNGETQTFAPVTGLTVSAANRVLRFLDVVGGGAIAGSPPESIIGGGSGGLLFVSRDKATMKQIDFGLDPKPDWYGVTAFDGRAVLFGAQQQPDQSYDYVLALASLHADLTSASAWDVVDIVPSVAGDAFGSVASDGRHLYLVGARPSEQLVAAKWRYSLPPAPLADYRLGGAIPNGWTTTCEGSEDPSAAWRAAEGYVVEAGNCYDVNSEDAGPLAKLGTYLWAKPVTFGEGRLSVVANPTDDDGWGVMYNVRDDKNYYRISFDRQRGYARLVKSVNGVFTALGERLDYSFPLGHFHRIDIIRTGTSHLIRLDGGQVFNVTDATFSGGSVALYGWGMNEIRFARMSIYRP